MIQMDNRFVCTKQATIPQTSCLNGLRAQTYQFESSQFEASEVQFVGKIFIVNSGLWYDGNKDSSKNSEHLLLLLTTDKYVI